MTQRGQTCPFDHATKPLPGKATPASTPGTAKLAPLVRGWPIAGIAWQMRVDPLGTTSRAMAELGDTVRLKLGPFRATLFRNPEHLKHLFVDNVSNYSKQTRGYQKSKLVLGEGLVTSDGELWQRQRRIANPAFSRNRVNSFAGVMTAAVTAMLDRWETAVERVDMFTEMMRVTLTIALQTLLGVGEGAETDKLGRAVSTVLERTNDIITNPLSLPVWVPTPNNISFRRAIAQLDDFVYETIRRRREATAASMEETTAGESRPDDLLGMLMAARDEVGGGRMSDRQLRDEAVTILIAGHETVANVLTWALHLLSRHPEQQDRLAAEAAVVLSGRLPTAEDAQRLVFTRQVVDESMRLYPPAWMIGRAAVETDSVGGWRVDRGTFALVSPYLTHRHPGLWDRPDEFDPDRFGDGRAERLPKFSYLPFGAGPRFCIGGTFALLDSTLLLSSIAQRFRVEPVEGARIEPYAMITLRPKFGMPLRIVRRR
jgi:cytochrome P450